MCRRLSQLTRVKTSPPCDCARPTQKNLLTDLLTSKPEGLRDSLQRRQFGQSIEKLPKLNVAGSNPVTRFQSKT